MTAEPATGIASILKTAFVNALIALVLFSLMVGIRTEAGASGQLTYWTRFGELASLVAAVFGGSIVIELLRQWIGPTGTEKLVPPAVQSGMPRPMFCRCRQQASCQRKKFNEIRLRRASDGRGTPAIRADCGRIFRPQQARLSCIARRGGACLTQPGMQIARSATWSAISQC